MKKFNAGDLSKKPSEVWAAAREGGAIIQHKDRSGKNVVDEFVMVTREFMHQCVDSSTMADGRSGDTPELKMWHATQPNLDCNDGDL